MLRDLIEKNQVLVFNWMYDVAAERHALPPASHSDLAGVLVAGDPAAADQAMRAHIRYGLEERVSNLQAGTRNEWRRRTIGLSNTTQESQVFLSLAAKDKDVNPKFLGVDGAAGQQTATRIARPAAAYWETVAQRLAEAQVSANQVQVVWIKEADSMPTGPFPREPKKLQSELAAIVRILHGKFSNLRLAYLSSRIYAGFAAGPLNPEPHAYESDSRSSG